MFGDENLELFPMGKSIAFGSKVDFVFEILSLFSPEYPVRRTNSGANWNSIQIVIFDGPFIEFLIGNLQEWGLFFPPIIGDEVQGQVCP